MRGLKQRPRFVCWEKIPPPLIDSRVRPGIPRSSRDAVTRWFPSGAVEGRPRRIKASRGLEREVAPCFQLIHLLPDVASHLSWLETAHRPGILMTAALHPSSSLPTAPHIISTPLPSPPLFLVCFRSSHALHSVCSTDFLPPHFHPSLS